MPLIPLTVSCILALTAQHKFPTETLWALFAQEGGAVGMEVPNKTPTGKIWSYDLGPLQVNTKHIPKFAALWKMDADATRAKLRDDGCANAAAASILLAEHWRRTGDITRAIGDYHSKTAWRSEAYKEKVLARARDLYKNPSTSPKQRR
jgi:hypothetical protein